MPELPEVETVARQLREGLGAAPSLIGRRIQEARVLWPREANLGQRAFDRTLAGLRFAAIDRHGKYLIFRFEPGRRAPVMLVHLKMSGRLDIVTHHDAFTPHARAVWLLDDGYALRFDDARKFGRVYVVDDERLVTNKLGPDALLVSEDEFVTRLGRKSGAIKPILLDQGFVAGVGNIYADESLWLARLHPKRRAAALDPGDGRRLYAAVRRVLVEAIAANGASFDWVYPSGSYQDDFKVYGRTGAPCVQCGRPVERILVGQRSTHFCPGCQT